jgi:GNAT superfamily N-acetyltransferase
MNKINLDKIIFCKADRKLIEESSFDCGEDDLNDFFLKDSLLNIDDSLSVIYVCKYNEKIIAFFSLSADSIKINEPLTIRYPQYPAVKIGRLGVHKDYQNMKIGSLILSWVVGFCRQLRKDIGLRFISVDVYNNSSTLNFFKKNLFKELNVTGKKKNRHNIPLYKDI